MDRTQGTRRTEGRQPLAAAAPPKAARAPLYTPAERQRRDTSPWTLVQGVLAPVQFVVFLVSLALVLRWLATGQGYEIATASVVVKTLTLYTIMATGCIWEKVVFGRWLFAPSFVTVGPPNDLSMMTLRPVGPIVTATALANFSTPLSILARA